MARLLWQGWQGAPPQFHTLVLDLNDPEMIFTETGKPIPEATAEELAKAAAHLAPPVPKVSSPATSPCCVCPQSSRRYSFL